MSKLSDILVERSNIFMKNRREVRELRISRTYADALSLYRAIDLQSKGPDGDVVERLALNIQSAGSTRLTCCIPCHVKERIDAFQLTKLAQLYAGVGGSIVIFVNSSQYELTPLQFAHEVEKIRSSVTDKSINIISHQFETKPEIGRVRGMLTDSVAVAAGLSGIDDPIAVSNDIDILDISSGYVRAVLKAFENKHTDVVTGPTYYGCSPFGKSFIKQLIPELMISNRFVAAFQIALFDSSLVGYSYLQTVGPNTAYRLSSYCDCGGYDYSVTTGEDDAIGRSLWSLRGGIKCGSAYVSTFAQHLDEMWLATDPRRQLRSLNRGHSLKATWKHEHFATTAGHALDTEELCQEYLTHDRFLQVNDIRDFVSNGAATKVLSRVKDIFEDNITISRLKVAESAEVLAPIYGLYKHPGKGGADWQIANDMRDAFTAFLGRS